MPCPHFDVKIIQRSTRQSAVASAACQSGERLFSEYDQKQKYYSHKSEIVHTEIMLPPHALPEYADRNILWNASEAIEKHWNSQLAQRFVACHTEGTSPVTVRRPFDENNKNECSYSVSNAIRTLVMVRQKGLEPPTYWFVASHSIQLSYSRIPHTQDVSRMTA